MLDLIRRRTALLLLLMGWATATPAQMVVQTQDGLGLVFDAQGGVAALTIDGQELPLLELPGGFFVEDLMQSVPLSYFETRVEMVSEGIMFSGHAPDLALELEAVISAQADHIRVDGKVRDTTGQDRGLRVGFGLPVDAGGWTWWDDIATPRPIARGDTYGYYGADWTAGQRQLSVYPFASMTGKDTGLALAQRVDQPRFFRLLYDSAVGYRVDYELGLAADTAKFPSSASFHFIIYRHDAAWGMRSAAQRFYEIFPESFQVRAERQGLYCNIVPTDLASPEDFGFTYDLAGFHQPERQQLKQHGIYLLVHPMGTEAHIRWPEGYDWGTDNGRPSLEQVEEIILTPRPEYADGPKWRDLSQRYGTASFEDNRQRVVNSAVYDSEGHFRLFPYNKTIEFIATSADPELPSPNMAGGERKYYVGRHEAIAVRAGSEIDGVDFDNIDLSTGRTRENFRREHFRYVDHPIVYDAASGRLCISTGMSYYEFVKEISDEMHAEGKLCTGNVGRDPHTQTFFGHLLDKHGGEIQFHAPTRDLRAFRTLAYQKPVAHIIYAGAVSASQQERVMHRWLAFGEFPTITELAYSRGADFERGRPLYRRFMPTMQRVAQAGWEPITYARVEGEGLFVERFGNSGDGDLHFTVHNDTDEPRAGQLMLDRELLEIEDGAVWVELLSGEILDATTATEAALQPHHTKVYHIFPPSRGTLPWWHDSFRLTVAGGGRVLQGNSVSLEATVEGASGTVETSLVLPPGWTVEEESEQGWLLLPAQDAQAGEAEVSAQVVGKDGVAVTLQRSVQLDPVQALELATDKLDLTLDVPYPLSVTVRNNSGQRRPAAVVVVLPEELGGGTAQGEAQIPAGAQVDVPLALASPARARPGTYPVEVTLAGRRQAGKLQARQGLLARQLKVAPTLDGVLDEWTEPSSAARFRRFGAGDTLTQQTRVWVGYDRAALYLAFHCAEDRMAQLRANVTQPDGPVWQDDDVAIFLDPGASRGTYYQLEINSLGTVFDSSNDDRSWDSGARTGARHDGAAWILEVAIPWDDLATVARPGQRWGINLGRQQKSRPETSSITSTFKETVHFADLIFE
jgi:hypothetical protein